MRKFLAYLVTALTALCCMVGPAYGASFDCQKARTVTEKIICEDATLDALDLRLAAAYVEAVDRADDQQGLFRSQKEWIHTRDRCADAACIKASYLSRMGELKQVKVAGYATYHDPTLGVSFDYLANRRVKKSCGADGGCSLALIGRNMGPSHYIVRFTLKSGDIDTVAQDAGFEHLDDGKWTTRDGPGVPMEPDSFNGRGWKGMRATIACGVWDPETGMHTGECLLAALSNGTRGVVVDTEGSLGTDAPSVHSVESFRFTR